MSEQLTKDFEGYAERVEATTLRVLELSEEIAKVSEIVGVMCSLMVEAIGLSPDEVFMGHQLNDGKAELIQKIHGAFQRTRKQALTEAAEVCDAMHKAYCSPAECAEEIRRLIDGPKNATEKKSA